MTIKYIDLFCGIGGFHQAMKRIGGECVMACDIDESCRKIYKENYNIDPLSDIKDVDPNELPDFDIILGGFPCQSFSNSGKKKGLDDERGQLFNYIINIANIKRPKFMFLENVKHIRKIDNGKVFEYLLQKIDSIGYSCNVIEISPHELGVPQQRERVIFICIRNDIYDKDKKIDYTPSNKQIILENFLEKNPDKKYNVSNEIKSVLEAWDEMIHHVETNEKLSPTILCKEFKSNYSIEEFNSLAKWKQDYITKNRPLYEKYSNKWDEWFQKYNSLLTKREVYCKLEWQVGLKKENDSIFNHFIQVRQSGIRVKKAKYFPTLVAIVQTPIYGKEKRYITPRECARLQSFPDDFIMHTSDNVAYKQFGNAVNVDVVHHAISLTLSQYLC
jgi:DNA (cytosine-5)-methyltransferase 1